MAKVRRRSHAKKDAHIVPSAIREILPMIFDHKQLSILCSLAEVYPRGLSYSEIADITGLSKGSSVDYNLDSLKKIGFVYRKEEGKNSYYYLTEAGKIATLGLHSMIYRLIQDLRTGAIPYEPGLTTAVQEELQEASARILQTIDKLRGIQIIFPHRPKFYSNRFVQ
jgi:DNA-binding transcriptional ArsR family regulator